MKILKRYKEQEAQWEKTTEKECLEHTEESGYWKRNSVLAMLERGQPIFTPVADYKKA